MKNIFSLDKTLDWTTITGMDQGGIAKFATPMVFGGTNIKTYICGPVFNRFIFPS